MPRGQTSRDRSRPAFQGLPPRRCCRAEWVKSARGPSAAAQRLRERQPGGRHSQGKVPGVARGQEVAGHPLWRSPATGTPLPKPEDTGSDSRGHRQRVQRVGPVTAGWGRGSCGSCWVPSAQGPLPVAPSRPWVLTRHFCSGWPGGWGEAKSYSHLKGHGTSGPPDAQLQAQGHLGEVPTVLRTFPQGQPSWDPGSAGAAARMWDGQSPLPSHR